MADTISESTSKSQLFKARKLLQANYIKMNTIANASMEISVSKNHNKRLNTGSHCNLENVCRITFLAD